MLALAEIRRGKGRFAAIVAALALLVFLVLVLGALSDGLYYGATGAVRSTSATGYVFDKDAEGSLVRSRVPAADVATVDAVPGVTAAGPVGVLLTGGTGPQGPIDLAVFGIDPGGPGTPSRVVDGRLPAPGEQGVAAVDTRLQQFGVELGSTVKVGEVLAKVVGFTADSNYQLQPSLWTTVTTWRAMRDAVRPEQRGQTADVNAIAVTTDSDAALAAISALPGLAALSAEQTALAIPGVEQQKSTLNSIIYTTLAVAAVVVGLFFALLVLEKRELFAALKALGASTGKLGRSVIVQALVASVLAVILGSVLARLAGLVIPATVPTLFRTQTLITIGIFTIVAGVVGALFSLRRIAKIDPATAIGGTL